MVKEIIKINMKKMFVLIITNIILLLIVAYGEFREIIFLMIIGNNINMFMATREGEGKFLEALPIGPKEWIRAEIWTSLIVCALYIFMYLWMGFMFDGNINIVKFSLMIVVLLGIISLDLVKTYLKEIKLGKILNNITMIFYISIVGIVFLSNIDVESKIIRLIWTGAIVVFGSWLIIFLSKYYEKIKEIYK